METWELFPVDNDCRKTTLRNDRDDHDEHDEDISDVANVAAVLVVVSVVTVPPNSQLPRR